MAEVARQLRKPEGAVGLERARRMNESNRALTEAAFATLALDKARYLLEVGPGNAALSMPYLEAHPQLAYTGLDYAPDMVAQATELHRRWVDAGRASFVEGHAEAIPFGPQTFDRIVTVKTLYFAANPAAVLAEYARVLQPGGRLVLAVRDAAYMRQLPFTHTGFRLYDPDELEALFAAGPWASITFLPFTEQMRTSAAGHTGPAQSHIVVAVC